MRSAARKISTIGFLQKIRDYGKHTIDFLDLINYAQEYAEDVLGKDINGENSFYFLLLDLFSAYREEDVLGGILLSSLFKQAIHNANAVDFKFSIVLDALEETDRIVCCLTRKDNELTSRLSKKQYFFKLRNTLLEKVVNNTNCLEGLSF